MRDEKPKKQKSEQKQRENNHIICTSSISRRVSLVIFILLAGFITAMATYGGTFHFWRYPVCDLGTLYTVAHQKFNITSLLFFDLAMLASGFLMMQIGRRFTSEVPFKHKKVKQVLSFTCGLGFILMIFPYTIHIVAHIIGAIFVIISLWILATLFLFEVKPYISPVTFLFGQLLLHGSIVTYGILFVMQMAENDAAQKIGILSLMIVLWVTTRYRGQKNISLKNYENATHNCIKYDK